MQQQRSRTTQQMFEVHWWFSWAGIRAEEFKDFATAVSTCLLLKRQDKRSFCFLFLIYIVKSEDANYWQREKEESLRKGIDETRPAKC